MARTKVSTTVDEDLLASARRTLPMLTDAALLDQALAALSDRHRAAEIDAAYTVYDEHPLSEPDDWGDLASFREAGAAAWGETPSPPGGGVGGGTARRRPRTRSRGLAVRGAFAPPNHPRRAPFGHHLP